jgi:hypothetical protein
MVQYYAITKYGMTKTAPFALVRFKEGIFEIFRNGSWEETRQFDDILIGEFNDYEIITDDEAKAIQQKMMARIT